MIWFYSDPHFHHAKILEYQKRPFATVEEMDRVLVERFNQVVKERDIVYLMGDIVFCKTVEDFVAMIRQLKGTFRIIRGNHDRLLERKADEVMDFAQYKCGKNKIEWIRDYHYLKLPNDGLGAVLMHYPMGSWRNARHGTLMLHGHTHGSYDRGWPVSHSGGKIMDVGVDCHDYFPVSENQVREIMKNLPVRTNRYDDVPE